MKYFQVIGNRTKFLNNDKFLMKTFDSDNATQEDFSSILIYL